MAILINPIFLKEYNLRLRRKLKENVNKSTTNDFTLPAMLV